VVQVVVSGVVEVVVQVGEYLVVDQVVCGEDGAGGGGDQVQGEDSATQAGVDQAGCVSRAVTATAATRNRRGQRRS
jgi:hypothetical protein